MQIENENVRKNNNDNKTKKILSIVGNVIIWIIVAFAILVTAFVLVAQNNKDGIPEVFGKSFISIETNSMEPTYKVGDLVFLTKLTEAEKLTLKPGDIITFRSPVDINGDGKTGDINTHRIEKIEGNFIYTKGDNADATIDEPISYGEIIGVCTEKGKISGIGGITSFLRSQLGFFLCVVLPMVLFFLYELYNFISLIVARKAKANISKEDEEEIKRKAIEEYLAQQKNEQSEPIKDEKKTEIGEVNKED